MCICVIRRGIRAYPSGELSEGAVTATAPTVIVGYRGFGGRPVGAQVPLPRRGLDTRPPGRVWEENTGRVGESWGIDKTSDPFPPLANANRNHSWINGTSSRLQRTDRDPPRKLAWGTEFRPNRSVPHLECHGRPSEPRRGQAMGVV